MRRSRSGWNGACLLAANVHMLDAYFVDQTFANPIASPITVGTSGLSADRFHNGRPAGNASYTVDQNVQGVDYAYNPINWGRQIPGPTPGNYVLGPLSVLRGSNTSVTVTVDSQNTVAESNENDNTTSFSFYHDADCRSEPSCSNRSARWRNEITDT